MPYCPKCRTEYREGFKECADCGTTLVDVLPDLVEKPEMVFEKLVHVKNDIELSYITSLLDENDILYRVSNGKMEDIMDFAYGKVTPLREIFVDKDKMNEAMQIVLSIAGEIEEDK